jgi:Fe-S oxidoreductase
VDVAKLKAEHTQAYYTKHPRPLGHRMVKTIHRASPWASRFAGPLNWLGRRKTVRRVMEHLAGFDRRRSLPHWERNHFRKWMDHHSPLPGAMGRVVVLDDCFTTYQESRIGRAAVTVLEAAGYRVELAGICCGRAMISKGYLKETQRMVKAQVGRLAKRVADGTPILGLEPSCLLSLVDEWPELAPGPDAKAVAAASHLLEHWLPEQPHQLRWDTMPNQVLFHGHCHQKALVGTAGTVKALGCVPGLDVTPLDAGCCGMAGAFGYEKQHFDLSVKIANLALVPAIQAHPLAVLVANGTSCRHQIRDLTGRTAFHPIEVLANALKVK